MPILSTALGAQVPWEPLTSLVRCGPGGPTFALAARRFIPV